VTTKEEDTRGTNIVNTGIYGEKYRITATRKTKTRKV
jgi:hypothetical protein